MGVFAVEYAVIILAWRLLDLCFIILERQVYTIYVFYFLPVHYLI